MIKYNKKDVILLEKVYLTLRPWAKSHPSVAFSDGCPKCGGKQLQSRGQDRTKTAVYKRYQCQSCGGWCRARVAEKAKKPGVVNL